MAGPLPAVGFLRQAQVLTFVPFSAATLWQTARKARLDELGHLRSLLDQQGSDSKSTVRKEIEATIQQIEGVKTGAYAGLVHNPIVAALLLPAGGIGLLEFLPLLVAG